MAAEGVILENLETTLNIEEHQLLLSSVRLTDLAESLKMIKGAVAALEDDEDHSLRGSLENLVALLHQADDLLDDILTRANSTNFARVEDQNGNLGGNVRRGLQRMVNASSRVAQKVSLFFPSNRLLLMARRVEKIGQEIKVLGMQMRNNFDTVDLLERPFEPPRYSYSLNRNRVIGRDNEKQKIIEMLLRPSTENETSVSVIPIVGSPGIGKSALAQFVYDDEKVKSHFDLRMWIQVSQITDEREIIQEIVESCTNRRSSNNQNPKPAKFLHARVHQNGLTFRNLLGCQNLDTSQTAPSHSFSKNKANIYERRLQKEIEGKLYLLILDDACITHGQHLKDILATGARGSRVLVTTRHVAVADNAKTDISESYKLKGLSQNDSWFLFENFALGQDNRRNPEQENQRDPELEQIGLGEEFSKDMANTGLKALKKLNNLRGRLAIELTGEWTTAIPEAPQAELRKKKHLRELKISWEKRVSKVEKVTHLLSEEEKSSHKHLLEQLHPNSKLKILCIEGYKGEDFPIWAGVNRLATSLPNLVVISIEGCEKCEHLPPFGELPSLKRLTLRHMANVRYVEKETLLESPLFFPFLEELTLHNFYKLEGWRKEVTITSRQQEAIRSFPCLTKLMIWNCPNLRSMPLFMKVLDLNLRNVNQLLLEECAKKASGANRQQLGNISRIRDLQIKGCPNLRSFEAVRQGLGNLPNLKLLVVERCHALSLLAPELQHLTSLERLEISSCKELDLSDNGTSTTGNFKTISRLPIRLAHHLRGTSRTPWTSLTCLRHLTLREIPKMETLPEGLKYVQSLRSLWISACPSLTALPEWIGCLTALQHLRIESCRRLTRLPDGLREVESLMKVEITECPELMERCREHTGEDWHKIKKAQILLHKSWRYGLMSELGAPQNRSNVQALTDVKYFIVPMIAA
ncbi:hypothetical protein SOVF_079690, partial [Spinacia oleracea]